MERVDKAGGVAPFLHLQMSVYNHRKSMMDQGCLLGGSVMKKNLISFLLLILLLAVPSLAALSQEQPQAVISGNLAYTGEDGNLWVVLEDSGERFALTSDAGPTRRYLSPRWSPDGQHLAFCQKDSEEKSGSLLITRAGEWLPLLLAEDVYCREWPQGSFDWSDDGSKIVYARLGDVDGKGGIWSVDFGSAGHKEMVVAPGGGQLLYPDFAPAGGWLRVYEPLYLEGLGVLRTWQAEGQALYSWLEIGSDLFPGFSSWSPDGSRLVFDQVTFLGFPGAGLFLAGPAGGDLQKIFSRSEEAAERPLWSPRGDLIAFLLTSPVIKAYEGARLGLVAPDGNGFREITRREGRIEPLTWSEDGRYLLYGEGDQERVQLFSYDVDTGTALPVLTMGGWDVSWSHKPLILDVAKDTSPQNVASFPFREDLLLYLSGDYRLKLETADGSQAADLSRPMTVAGFWVSPSRQRILTSGRLFSLNFQENEELVIQQGALPQPAAGRQVRWSPDENQVAYQNRAGAVWIARLDGSSVELTGAAQLPEWSHDSQWLSYCDSESDLWIFGVGSPARRIAENTSCDQRWSTRRSLLAFTLPGAEPPATSSVQVYDPVGSAGKTLLEQAVFEAWSPDGALVSLRQESVPAGRYTIFVQEPVSQRRMALGQFEQGSPGIAGWLPAPAGYQYGPYRLSENLDTPNRIVDIIFDSSPAGDHLLVGIGSRELVTLACLTEGQTQQQLFTVALPLQPDPSQPTIKGKISPSGEWAAVYAVDQNQASYRLVRCADATSLNLPLEAEPGQGGFSPDGHWFVQAVSGSSGGQAYIFDLAQQISKTITSVQGSPAYWLGSLPAASPVQAGNYQASGRLTGPQGLPLPSVEILLDGRAAGVTDVDGRFLIIGLGDGSHTIQPSLESWSFQPKAARISTPPDAVDLVFIGQHPSIQESEPKAAASQPLEPTPVPVETVAPPPASLPDWAYSAWGWVTGLLGRWLEAWPGVASGIRDLPLEVSLGAAVLALLLLVLVTRRRRVVILARGKKTALPAEPAEQTVAQAESVQTVQEAADSQVVQLAASGNDELLRRGAELIRAGDVEGGISCLRKILEDEPENPRAWMWLGWAAVRQNDRKTAERCFRQAERLGHPKANEALSWLKR